MVKKRIRTVVLPSKMDAFNYINQNKKIYFDILLSFHKINLFSLLNEKKIKGIQNHLKAYSNNYKTNVTKKNLRIYRYRLDLQGSTHEVLLRDCHYKRYYINNYRSPYVMVIRKPSPYLLRLINDISAHNASWKISEVEFVCDFVGPDLDSIFSFLKRHIYLTWRGPEFITDYKTSIYLNNIRKSRGLGGKIYLRPKNDPDRVRLELTAKGPFFNRRKIRNLFQLLAMRPEEIFKRVPFKDIKVDRFKRHLHRQDKKQGPPFQAKARLEEMLRIWDGRGINAARGVIAKYYTNPGYCLVKHPFQDDFMQALQGLSFSDGVKWKTGPEGLWVPAHWAEKYKRPRFRRQ